MTRICLGAEPLFFLDYVAMSRDDPDLLQSLVQGMSDGCLAADCSLLGGETAIMPDLYQPGDYDLAGFCVGVVERKNMIDGTACRDGDLLLAAASSGLHSNGYSLARKIVFEHARLRIDDHVEELGETVGQALLRPTRIYVPVVRSVLRHYAVKRVVHGIAHITGGGLEENVGRIIPGGLRACIDWQTWMIPPVFRWLQRLGHVDEQEMRRVFNMGVGLVFAVSAFHAAAIQRIVQQCGCECWEVGRLERDPRS